MPKMCSQCSTRPAIVIAGGHPLCVVCNELLTRAQVADLQQTMAALNMLSGFAEASTGIPQPRIRIPSYPTPPASLTMNTFNIKDSEVGVINTGTVQNIQATVSAMRGRGETDVAAHLEKLCAAILASDLEPSLKQEALENVGFVVEQVNAPKAQRKPSLFQRALNRANEILAPIATLAQIWGTLVTTIVASQQHSPPPG